MFTGIIEEIGRATGCKNTALPARVSPCRLPEFYRYAKRGNGSYRQWCLPCKSPLMAAAALRFTADVMHENLRRSPLSVTLSQEAAWSGTRVAANGSLRRSYRVRTRRHQFTVREIHEDDIAVDIYSAAPAYYDISLKNRTHERHRRCESAARGWRFHRAALLQTFAAQVVSW